MESLARADIFFVTTTVVVVLVAVLVCILLVYAIRFFQDLNHVSKKVREESDEMIKDIKDIRTTVKKEVSGIGSITTLISKFFKRKKKQ
jgi:hypothetical protein